MNIIFNNVKITLMKEKNEDRHCKFNVTVAALLGCNDSDLKKEFDLSISSILGDYIIQTACLKQLPRPPYSTGS